MFGPKCLISNILDLHTNFLDYKYARRKWYPKTISWLKIFFSKSQSKDNRFEILKTFTMG